jgi:hypothetical protein
VGAGREEAAAAAGDGAGAAAGGGEKRGAAFATTAAVIVATGNASVMLFLSRASAEPVVCRGRAPEEEGRSGPPARWALFMRGGAVKKTAL